MTITREDVESILIKRVGKLMTAADMDGSTVDGTNVDLNDPVGRALRRIGYTTADITAVADADIANVGVVDYDKFLDVSEYHVLQNVMGNFDDVDISVGPRSESLSQLVKQAERKLKQLEEYIIAEYDLGLSELDAGKIDLNFVTHGDDTVVA